MMGDMEPIIRTIGLTRHFGDTVAVSDLLQSALLHAQGHLVRTLLAGESLAVGKHETNWDGLDRLGKAMPSKQTGK